MEIALKSRSAGLPERARAYVDKKLARLDRYFHEIRQAEMEQRFERGQYIVEVTLIGDGITLRAQVRNSDLFAAVDSVVDKLESQITRFKEKIIEQHRKPSPIREEMPENETESHPAPRIVRRKRYVMKPMPPEDAIRQMELVGHDFFVFQNQETGFMNVLYRRQDGDYGLIEPEH